MATKKKKTAATPTKAKSWKGDRVKCDVRVSEELDLRIEKIASRLGTTKNSVILIGALQFVAKLEVLAVKGKSDGVDAKSLVTQALQELSEVV